MTNPSNIDPLEALTTAAIQVLEITAFAFAEVASAADGLELEAGCMASVTMTGDLHAVLSVAAPHELCQLLSADTVGLEPEDISPQQAADMLGELANIVAGQVATQLQGEQAVVLLEPPQISEFTSPQDRASGPREWVVLLQIDDLPVRFALCGRDFAPVADAPSRETVQ